MSREILENFHSFDSSWPLPKFSNRGTNKCPLDSKQDSLYFQARKNLQWRSAHAQINSSPAHAFPRHPLNDLPMPFKVRLRFGPKNGSRVACNILTSKTSATPNQAEAAAVVVSVDNCSVVFAEFPACRSQQTKTSSASSKPGVSPPSRHIRGCTLTPKVWEIFVAMAKAFRKAICRLSRHARR